MIKPPIEELLKETPGRFALVIASARRAKDINSYVNQLGFRKRVAVNEKQLTTWYNR